MKTNKELVKYINQVLAQVKTTYGWGWQGQLVTEDKIQQVYRLHSSGYTNEKLKSMRSLIGKDYYGVDCVGLIKGFLWGASVSNNMITKISYQSASDVTADGMLTKCKEKGTIKTIPEIEGVLVFMKGHVGVYIGDGYVIESTSSTKFAGSLGGVCKTKLKDRTWTHWGKCPYISYETEDTELLTAVRYLNSKGASIDEKVWGNESTMDMRYAQTLVEKLGKNLLKVSDYHAIINKLVDLKVISNISIWDSKRFTPDRVKSLLTKLSKAV